MLPSLFQIPDVANEISTQSGYGSSFVFQHVCRAFKAARTVGKSGKRFATSQEFLILACQGGAIDLVKWGLRHGCWAPLSDCAVAAAYNGHKELLEFFLPALDPDADYAYNITNASTFSPSAMEVVTLLQTHHFPFGMRSLAGAASRGDNEMLEALLARFSFTSPVVDIGEPAISFLAASGRIDLYQKYTEKLGERRRRDLNREVANAAATAGQLKFLQFLAKSDIQANSDMISSVPLIRAGHLEVLDWAIKQQWTKVSGLTIAAACELGDIALLDFLLERTTPFYRSYTAAVSAARCGRLEMVKYFQDQDPHLFKSLFTQVICAAAEGGHTTILEHYKSEIDKLLAPRLTREAANGGYMIVLLWLKENDLLDIEHGLDSAVLTQVASLGHLSVVKFMLDCGAVPDVDFYTSAGRSGRLDVMRYAYNVRNIPFPSTANSLYWKQQIHHDIKVWVENRQGVAGLIKSVQTGLNNQCSIS